MPEQLMETLTSNPLLIVVVAVLLLFIIIGLVKKLVKLALFFAIGLALFVAYLMYSGQEVPASLKGIEHSFQHGMNSLKEKSNELKEKVTDKITEKAKEEAGEILQGGLNNR